MEQIEFQSKFAKVFPPTETYFAAQGDVCCLDLSDIHLHGVQFMIQLLEFSLHHACLVLHYLNFLVNHLESF